jgi:DNA-binding IclR family transcriptional regulator
MAYTLHELKHKTLAELRDIAKDIDHEAVQGYTQMNKEHLLVQLCKALGIDMHEHHQVVGIDKAAIKAKIKQLKKERDQALLAHDRKQLKQVRRRIHRLNRQIRKAMVQGI